MENQDTPTKEPNKKLNTALFLLGATIVNIIMWAIIFFTGLIILSRVFSSVLNSQAGFYIIVGYFIGATVLTFFLYNRLVRYITGKFDFEKYFLPIFKKKTK